MKQFKINGQIVKANTIFDAIKHVKDSAASDIASELKSGPYKLKLQRQIAKNGNVYLEFDAGKELNDAEATNVAKYARHIAMKYAEGKYALVDAYVTFGRPNEVVVDLRNAKANDACTKDAPLEIYGERYNVVQRMGKFIAFKNNAQVAEADTYRELEKKLMMLSDACSVEDEQQVYVNANEWEFPLNKIAKTYMPSGWYNKSKFDNAMKKCLDVLEQWYREGKVNSSDYRNAAYAASAWDFNELYISLKEAGYKNKYKDACTKDAYSSWNEAYKDIDKIVNKHFPNTSKINAEVDKWYNTHKSDINAVKAYERWSEDDMHDACTKDARTSNKLGIIEVIAESDTHKYFLKVDNDLSLYPTLAEAERYAKQLLEDVKLIKKMYNNHTEGR